MEAESGRAREPAWAHEQPADTKRPPLATGAYDSLHALNRALFEATESLAAEQQTTILESWVQFGNRVVVDILLDNFTDEIKHIVDGTAFRAAHSRVKLYAIEQWIDVETHAFFFMMKEKGSALVAETVLVAVLNILRTGLLPAECSAEVFTEHRRLPRQAGSEGAYVIFSDELTSPLYDVPPPGGGWSSVGLCRDVELVVTIRDGCAAQFSSFKNHYSISKYKRKYKVHRADCRCPEHEGKGSCDGATLWLKSMIGRVAADDFGPGTQCLVRQLAIRFPRRMGSTTRYAGHRSNAITHIYYGYVPSDFGDVESWLPMNDSNYRVRAVCSRFDHPIAAICWRKQGAVRAWGV